MLSRQLMHNFSNKCDIYFEHSLISKELLIKAYTDFIASSFGGLNRTVGLVLHTGSICFDIVSILAAALGSLILDGSAADDIVSSLNEGAMVQYKNNRYLWGGLGRFGNDGEFIPAENVAKASHFLLIQRRSDKNLGENISKTMLPLASKNMIIPYYGNSVMTDGRGLRRGKTNRTDFIAYLFDVPASEISSVAGVSSVVVAERVTVDRIVKGLTISYDKGKSVNLLDIVTTSYFTDGEEYPYAGNPGKNDPVLKITGKISTARELILDKSGNKAVGLLVLGSESIAKGRSELPDLLNRKSLQYVYLSANIDSENAEEILSECEDASIFACTKEFLLSHALPPKKINRHTVALNKQITNIVNKKIESVVIPGDCSWEEYRAVKESLHLLKKYDWSGEEKDLFIINAYSLLNLFTTAVFPIKMIEEMINGGILDGRVASPRQRIDELWKLANKLPTSFANRAIDIIGLLERLYTKNESECRKYSELKKRLSAGVDRQIAVIVPKAYYEDVLAADGILRSEKVTVVTANRFDNSIDYDEIIVVGEISGKRFDTFRCRAASVITVLLYDFESRLFRHREKAADRFEQDLNKKTGLLSEDVQPLDVCPGKSSVESDNDAEILKFKTMTSDLDYYIEKIVAFDIGNLVGQVPTTGTAATADVVAVGTFTNGERILFSKYYKAFVFDKSKGTVTETEVEELESGDMLIFTRRDDFTRNMVDSVFDNLLSSGLLNESVKEAAFKLAYWKLALREYMDKHGCSYREISQRLSALGCKRHEVTIRTWLSDDYRIIGPLDEEAFVQIAELTADPDMKRDPKSFYEACRITRHERKKILSLIGRAIIDKLRGHLSEQDGLLEAVYDNIDKLAVMLELETVAELNEPVAVSVNMINKPLTSQEG